MISLNYQVSLFGNYAEIAPNSENIRYFLDQFSEKGFIPNTQNEINISENVNIPRLRLSKSDNSCHINLQSERIEFILANIDINVFDMPDFDVFIADCKDYIKKISQKYPNKHRRIGIMRNLFCPDQNEKFQNKFINNIPFFDNNLLQEWMYNVSTRENIANGEVLNITNTIRKIKLQITKNSRLTILDGILLNFDANTIDENKNYRFDEKNINNSIDNIADILNKVSLETFNYIKPNE
jgi:hypothetical protein